jgi:hypothetical protein
MEGNDMKKWFICILSLLSMVFSLASCAFEQANTDPDKMSPSGDYITLTVTGYNNGTDSDMGMTSQIWYYNVLNGEISHIFDFNTTAQYSLGIYDRENEKVYYSERITDESEVGYGDQIIACNLATKEETQLTHNFFSVNDMMPTDNRLYFVAAVQGDGAERLGYIDLQTGKIQYWREDGDTFIECAVIDQEKESIYFVGYSLEERAYNVAHQGNNNFLIPAHTVYRTDLDFSETEAIYSDNSWLRAIMVNGEKIDILCDEKYNHPEIPTTIITYNLETNEIQRKNWDANRLEQGAPNYSSDGKFIYGIITTEDGSRGVGEYNVETTEMRLCFETMPANFINNMQLIRQ